MMKEWRSSRVCPECGEDMNVTIQIDNEDIFLGGVFWCDECKYEIPLAGPDGYLVVDWDGTTGIK